MSIEPREHYDVQDSEGKWIIGQVLEVRQGREAKIHFRSFDSRFDEWIDFSKEPNRFTRRGRYSRSHYDPSSATGVAPCLLREEMKCTAMLGGRRINVTVSDKKEHIAGDQAYCTIDGTGRSRWFHLHKDLFLPHSHPASSVRSRSTVEQSPVKEPKPVNSMYTTSSSAIGSHVKKPRSTLQVMREMEREKKEKKRVTPVATANPLTTESRVNREVPPVSEKITPVSAPYKKQLSSKDLIDMNLDVYTRIDVQTPNGQWISGTIKANRASKLASYRNKFMLEPWDRKFRQIYVQGIEDGAWIDLPHLGPVNLDDVDLDNLPPNRIAPLGFFTQVSHRDVRDSFPSVDIDTIVYVRLGSGSTRHWAIGNVRKRHLTVAQYLVQYVDETGKPQDRWFHACSGDISLTLPEEPKSTVNISNEERKLPDVQSEEVPVIIPSTSPDLSDNVQVSITPIDEDPQADEDPPNDAMNMDPDPSPKAHTSDSDADMPDSSQGQENASTAPLMEEGVALVKRGALLDIRTKRGKWILIQVDQIDHMIQKVQVTRLGPPNEGKSQTLPLERLKGCRPACSFSGTDGQGEFEVGQRVLVKHYKTNEWTEAEVTHLAGAQVEAAEVVNAKVQDDDIYWYHPALDEVKQLQDDIEMLYASPDHNDNVEYVPFHPTRRMMMEVEGRNSIGCANLGNTCYMSCAVQLLCSVRPLIYYFMKTTLWQEYLNDNTGTRGKQESESAGRVAVEFYKILKQTSATDRNFANPVFPSRLKTAVDIVASRFIGYAQHDCQEFLLALLDALHVDLNQGHEAKTMLGGIYDEEDSTTVRAEKSWAFFQRGNASVIADLFYGQLASTTTCDDCGYASSVFNPMNLLSLDLPQEKYRFLSLSSADDVSLDQCLRMYTSPDLLVGRNQWNCERCKAKVDAKKTLAIQRPPHILIIQLKRFDPMSGERKGTVIKYPLQLDLTDFCNVSTQTINGVHYQLTGVVNHIQRRGGLKHYTCYLKIRTPPIVRNTQPSDRWCLFDDSRASLVPVTEVQRPSRDPYLLMYERIVD